jgi:hypothetical protein
MAANQVQYQFKREAFQYAFQGNDSEVVFTVEGDVYKDSIDPFNLVISNTGEIGPAGGAPVPVKLNNINMGAISNPVEYTRQLGAYYVRQMNLQEAVKDDLDFIGETMYGISRRAGEGDVGYRERIVSTILAIRCTPLSIENALVDLADEVEVDDDVASGAFSDVSFANYYKEVDYPPHVVRGAFAGSTGGLIFMYNVTLTNPDLAQADEIIRILKEFTAGGIVFNIFVE